MTEELKQKAENFIIDRYKLNESYREDNEETREYMRMDVHSQYEEEYQLYLAGAEPREKQIEELTEQNTSLLTSVENLNKSVQELEAQINRAFEVLEDKRKQIQIDAEQIRALQKQNGALTDRVKELKAQIEKMKNWCNCKNYQECLIELAEQGKGMKPSECCVNCKKWEIKENE